MAGIFDRMNRPGTGETEKTLTPNFLCGILTMRVANTRNNAALLTAINDELAPDANLDAAAQQDMLDIADYIDDGTGEAGKVARLSRFCYVAGIWEQGWAGITESEARTMTGVTFS